jgi:hypothetical protein
LPERCAYENVVAMVDHEALRAEALRIHARYVTEVVEALGLCPWAEGARLAGHVRTEVVFGREGDAAMLERLGERLAQLEGDPDAQIGLLVMPELTLGRIAMQHFTARLRESYRPASREHAFAMADFHPDATAQLDSAQRLVSFIRKSPDPSLQLVRRSAIEAVRLGAEPGTRFVDAATLTAQGLSALSSGAPSLSERVARANLRTVSDLGVAHVQGLLADIEADRDRSYTALGLSLPPWRTR